MDALADRNPLGLIGVICVTAGILLTLAGLGIFKTKYFTTPQGRRTTLSGLALFAVGIVFLWLDINTASKSAAVPITAVLTAPSLTLPPAIASVQPAGIQPTSINTIAPTETPTSIAATPEDPVAPSHSIACVTSQTSLVPSEVQAETFILTSFTLRASGLGLPLANGQEILFSTMNSFAIEEESKDPYRLRATIILLNGETITDYVPVFNSADAKLEGQARFGPFSMLLSDVRRVDFHSQGGCQ